MLWTATQRYRKSEKGRATANAYSHHYYHTVLKFNETEKAKRRIANRENHYKQYGLTPEQADIEKSKGCFLCGTKIGKMNVDHDHETGRYRGILCNPCNLMIGWLEKARPFMERIDKYLNKG